MDCRLLNASRELNTYLSNLLRNEKHPKIVNYTNIGKGFTLNDLKKEEFIDINLDNDHRRGHVVGFGTTGAGKSRFIENMVEQDIMVQGNCVVIIDPKIDNALLSRT